MLESGHWKRQLSTLTRRTEMADDFTGSTRARMTAGRPRTTDIHAPTALGASSANEAGGSFLVTVRTGCMAWATSDGGKTGVRFATE
jgi:hypothetical protein